MFFMRIISMKRDHESIFRFVSIPFNAIIMKRVMVMFKSMGKNMWGL